MRAERKGMGEPILETGAVGSDLCRVCGARSRYIFSQKLLEHSVLYYDCEQCGYFQTEYPHWLQQAYSRAINDVDTGIMFRNQLNVGRVVMTLLVLGRLHGRVVDYAGGYGILVRLLRDAGIDAYWRDRYCQNLVARGFEAEDNSSDLLTAFEVFEHMVEPVAELREMLREAPAVLLSTELIQTSSPPTKDWWYLGPEHGQHIGFFRRATLQWIASALGCHYDTDGKSLHLFTKHKSPAGWRTAIRLSRASRLLTRMVLRSKTMTDFERLRSH